MGRLPWQTLGPHSVEPGRQRRSDPDRLKTRKSPRWRWSNDEQRTLDEIERALRNEDPVFVHTVTFDHFRRHRKIKCALGFLLGIVALVVGEITAQAQIGSSGMNVGDRAVWPLVSPCRATVLGWTGRAAIYTRSFPPASN